jgi:carbamoyltransferase
MKIIGFTCHYTGNHDNSAALLMDGKVIFAESEERISRIKHDKQFPIKSIKHALDFGGVKLRDVDYFVSGTAPVNSFQLILNYLQGFSYTTPDKILTWASDRLFTTLFSKEKKIETNLPQTFEGWKGNNSKLRFVSHYLAHAETAYMFSGMKECLIVAWDGYGLNENGRPLCGSIYLGKDSKIAIQEELSVYSSLALYYGAVTIALGFKLNDGEGKTMGLAVYGKNSPVVAEIRKFFPYFNGKKWVSRTTWLEVNGVSRPEYFKRTKTHKMLTTLIAKYGDKQVAYAAQAVLEEEGEKFFRYLVKKYKQRKVALAGGIFLNVKFNMKLLEKKIIDELFVYPNPGDGGIAVGTAIALYKELGKKMEVKELESAALGCGFSEKEIEKSLKSFGKKIKFTKYNNLPKVIAKEIIKGKVIGWFQGRGEWGPRALGYRSVLADPRYIETKDRINSKLKQRDWFMPFAPAIMEEHIDDVLKNGYGTPFMTLTDIVKKQMAKKIPAAIHIDDTARSQIVKKKTNPMYWGVINEFYKLTGIPVILNTSFNKHGLPIVHSPKEAIEHLLWGCVDELAIGNYLVVRVS